MCLQVNHITFTPCLQPPVAKLQGRRPRTQDVTHRQHLLQRVTFIPTSRDQFVESVELNDLFEQESPAGRLYVKLKELGIPAEREWWINEEGTA